MHVDQVVQLVRDVDGVPNPCPDVDVLAGQATALAKIAAWVESKQLVCARDMEAAGAYTERVLAEATHANQRDADRIVARAKTADAAPVFGDALADGRVAGAHLDQLTGSLRRLEGDAKQSLLADADRLLALAAVSSPEEFGRALRAEERRLTDEDADARFERQKAAVRLQRRVESDSGMNVFTLTLDPLSGLKLHNKISAMTEALFHDRTPECCPGDPVEKQSFLRAHALMNIIEGKGVRLGRPEMTVVVDTTVSDPVTGGPVIDWGLPIEIPQRVLRDLAGYADVHTVVVRNGVVIHAPGELDLGRTTRLANRAQRRALRALYPTCAIPGCCTRFELCKIHHVVWWRRLGRTDLCNLIPICVKHHTLVHNGGWQLELKPDRTLTITYPDGSTMTTGPPKRSAA